MIIHTLGCGSAKPSCRHNPSSTIVDFRGNLMMVDCGEGAQKQMQLQHLKFSRLRHIFLTHLHGDHVFGLPGLVGTLALSGIGGDITIHTFKEGKEILQKILDFFSRELPIDVKFNILDPHKEEIALETSSLRVKTIPLAHRVPCVGYVFEEKPGLRHIKRDMIDFYKIPISQINRIKGGEDFVTPEGVIIPNERLTTPPNPTTSYAHISDTAYMPRLAEKIRGIDLLFHETTYLDSNAKDAVSRGHSTAKEAARVARDANAKCLLTGHYSSRYSDDQQFVEEGTEVFPNILRNYEGLQLDTERLPLKGNGDA